MGGNGQDNPRKGRPIVRITIECDPASEQTRISHPPDTDLALFVLGLATKVIAAGAAKKKREESKGKVQVAGAGAMRFMPGGKNPRK